MPAFLRCSAAESKHAERLIKSAIEDEKDFIEMRLDRGEHFPMCGRVREKHIEEKN